MFQKLSHVTDVILFGRILYCDKCKAGSFVFKNWVYKCHGFVSEWAECDNIIHEPMRRAVFIPETLRNAHAFLNREFKTRSRLLEYKVPVSLMTYSKES